MATSDATTSTPPYALGPNSSRRRTNTAGFGRTAISSRGASVLACLSYATPSGAWLLMAAPGWSKRRRGHSDLSTTACCMQLAAQALPIYLDGRSQHPPADDPAVICVPLEEHAALGTTARLALNAARKSEASSPAATLRGCSARRHSSRS